MKLIVEKILKVYLKHFCFFFILILFILAVKPSEVHCPDEELFLTVKLNGIDSNNVLLGDSNCKPNWSNETHVQFITHINNCSLV
jgi:hypothetical protein